MSDATPFFHRWWGYPMFAVVGAIGFALKPFTMFIAVKGGHRRILQPVEPDLHGNKVRD